VNRAAECGAPASLTSARIMWAREDQYFMKSSPALLFHGSQTLTHTEFGSKGTQAAHLLAEYYTCVGFQNPDSSQRQSFVSPFMFTPFIAILIYFSSSQKWASGTASSGNQDISMVS